MAAAEAGELIQLLRGTATHADRQRLATLDLDLAESSGPGYTDVVAYGTSDLRLLKLAGFRWSVLEDDLVGADREREKADAEYARAVAAKKVAATLPSGRTSYRQLADYNNDLSSLAQQYPTKAKLFTLKENSLENRTIRGLEISRNVNVSDGKPVFLMLGLHHAREWPSGELTIEFAYDLLKNDGVDTRITNILDKARVSKHQVNTLITNHTYSNLVLREPGYAGAPKTPDETIYKASGSPSSTVRTASTRRSRTWRTTTSVPGVRRARATGPPSCSRPRARSTRRDTR